jgi:hypothetical protein
MAALLANYYLSATGALGTGDGSSAANAADASTQVKLDAIWASYIGHPVNFFYAAGVYQTKGWFFQVRETVQSNQAHIGAGMNSTTLQLVGASSLTGDGSIFSVDGPVTIKNWSCQNMTLDCNATNQPKWTGAGGGVQAIGCNAGQNILIQNVKIINFGTATVGVECFPILIIGYPGQTNIKMTNVVINNCVFTSPVSGNKDGCSCSSIVDTVSANILCDSTCVISNCTYTNCFSTTTGQPGDFLYQHCYGAPVCINNTATNCDVGFYIEPSGQEFTNLMIQVANNTLTNVNRGAFVSMHNGAGTLGLNVTSDVYALNSSGTGIQVIGSGGATANINTLSATSCNITGGTNGIVFDSALTDIFAKIVQVTNCILGVSVPFTLKSSLIGEKKVIPPITVTQAGTYITVESSGAKIVADLVTGTSYYGMLQSVTSGPYNGYTAAMQTLVATFYNVE